MSDNRIRLLFLIDSLAMGGAERMLINLLSHLDPAGYNIRIAVFAIRDGNPLAKSIRQMGLPVDLIPVSRVSSPQALPRLMLYLRHHRIELIHSQLVTAITLGSLAGRMLNIPRLATLHTIDAPPPGTRSEKRRRLMWWALRHSCDRIIAVSDHTRRHHMEIGRLPDERLTTVYNGIERDRFNAEGQTWRQDIRREMGIGVEFPLLVTVAVLREPKGIQRMIGALPAIIERSPSTRYLIVGSGPYESRLQAQITTAGLEKYVIMTGSREDVPQILAAADVFIHPTLDDALPTVLAEAMAAGKAIVASDVGGVPEMVEHGRNGLLVPPGDEDALSKACLTLIQDPHTRQLMGSASLEISAAKFDIYKQVAVLDQIYRELVDRKRHD